MVKIAFALPVALALASYAPSAVAAPVYTEDALVARQVDVEARELQALYDIYERQVAEYGPELVERNIFSKIFGGIKSFIGLRRSLDGSDLEFEARAASDAHNDARDLQELYEIYERHVAEYPDLVQRNIFSKIFGGIKSFIGLRRSLQDSDLALEARADVMDGYARELQTLCDLYERHAAEYPEIFERNIFSKIFGGIKSFIGLRRSLEANDMEYRGIDSYDELD